MGHSNTNFSPILTKIGGGVPLDTEEMAVIQSRFKTREWCDENVRDAVRLFHDNRSVNEYTSRAIRHPEYDSIARDSFAGYKTEEELAKARKELYRMKSEERIISHEDHRMSGISVLDTPGEGTPVHDHE